MSKSFIYDFNDLNSVAPKPKPDYPDQQGYNINPNPNQDIIFNQNITQTPISENTDKKIENVKTPLRKKSMRNRILWFTSCIIIFTSIGFYAFVVQPIIFDYLYLQTNATIVEIENEVNGSFVKIETLVADIDKNTDNIATFDNCNNQTNIDTIGFNQQAFNSILNKNIMNNISSSIGNDVYVRYGFFNAQYQRVYSAVNENVNNIYTTLEFFEYIPALNDYKNHFIDSCKFLFDKGFTIKNITDQCAELAEFRDQTLATFKDLNLPSNSRAIELVKNSLSSCATLPVTGRNNIITAENIRLWKEKFASNYDLITRKNNTTDLNKSVRESKEKISSTITQVRTSLKTDYDKKTKDGGFYILEPNLRAILRRE
jgi:hypothetical protein